VTPVTVFSPALPYDSSMESSSVQSCLDCVLRPDRLFCDLPAEALPAFDGIKTVSNCARGTTLFREGQAAHGIYLLCSGRAKLTICSESGKRMTLRIVGPGEVLGLSASLAGSAYEVTAELLEDSHVAMVKRKELMQFLHEHHDVCLQVVHALSQDLHSAYDRVRSVGLRRTRRSRVH
jgi:CRP/FNR family cyclic AMP-dependent transcriptional regulator